MTKNYAQLGATGQYGTIAILGAFQIIVGAGLKQAGYYLSNKTALTWDHIEDNFAEFIIESAARGGAGGIFYDLATDDSAKYGGDIFDTVLGPTAGTVKDTFSILSGLRDEALGLRETDDKIPKYSGRFARIIHPLLPGSNLPIFSDILNYLVFYNLYEWANPGYLNRMKNRLERQTGQEYLMKPEPLILDFIESIE